MKKLLLTIALLLNLSAFANIRSGNAVLCSIQAKKAGLSLEVYDKCIAKSPCSAYLPNQRSQCITDVEKERKKIQNKTPEKPKFDYSGSRALHDCMEETLNTDSSSKHFDQCAAKVRDEYGSSGQLEHNIRLHSTQVRNVICERQLGFADRLDLSKEEKNEIEKCVAAQK